MVNELMMVVFLIFWFCACVGLKEVQRSRLWKSSLKLYYRFFSGHDRPPILTLISTPIVTFMGMGEQVLACWRARLFNARKDEHVLVYSN